MTKVDQDLDKFDDNYKPLNDQDKLVWEECKPNSPNEDAFKESHSGLRRQPTSSARHPCRVTNRRTAIPRGKGDWAGGVVRESAAKLVRIQEKIVSISFLVLDKQQSEIQLVHSCCPTARLLTLFL